MLCRIVKILPASRLSLDRCRDLELKLILALVNSAFTIELVYPLRIPQVILKNIQINILQKLPVEGGNTV